MHSTNLEQHFPLSKVKVPGRVCDKTLGHPQTRPRSYLYACVYMFTRGLSQIRGSDQAWEPGTSQKSWCWVCFGPQCLLRERESMRLSLDSLRQTWWWPPQNLELLPTVASARHYFVTVFANLSKVEGPVHPALSLKFPSQGHSWNHSEGQMLGPPENET